MNIVNFKEMKAFSFEKMKKNKLFSTDRLISDLYCFEPKQKQKVHAHGGEDKIYCVLEGEGTFHIGDDSKTVGVGNAILAPAGLPHGVTNDSDGQLVVLVFMAPKPHH